MLYGDVSERTGPDGFHIDFTATDTHGDVSASNPTVGLGESFLTWIKPTQLGSSGHRIYPGVAAAAGGGWDTWFSLESADGTTYTSGTRSAHLRYEVDGGTQYQTASSFSLALNEWHVVGFTVEDGVSPTFFIDDMTRSTGGSSSSPVTLGSLGAGYNGSSNDGKGNKYMDGTLITTDLLTASEVADYYNSYTLPDNLKHLWTYDEGQGSTAADSVGTADADLLGSYAWRAGNAAAP